MHLMICAATSSHQKGHAVPSNTSIASSDATGASRSQSSRFFSRDKSPASKRSKGDLQVCCHTYLRRYPSTFLLLKHLWLWFWLQDAPLDKQYGREKHIRTQRSHFPTTPAVVSKQRRTKADVMANHQTNGFQTATSRWYNDIRPLIARSLDMMLNENMLDK